MSDDKDRLRRDRSALEQALSEAGAIIRGKALRCPFHEDRNSSGSIHQREDGVWAFKCFAGSCGFGGDVFDVREKASGRPVADQLRELHQPQQPPKPKPKVHKDLDSLGRAAMFLADSRAKSDEEKSERVEEFYRYQNPATGRIDMVVIRVRLRGGDKTFAQGHQVDSGFVLQAPPKPWPLYNRTRLAQAKIVVVVEGEKCVHAITPYLPKGWAATTSPAGAGKADHADWRPIIGKEKVILWPDNDARNEKTGKFAGQDHMRDVAAIGEALPQAPPLYWVDPDSIGVPEKGDCVDFIDACSAESAEAVASCVLAALSVARPLSGSRELGTLIEDTISGKWKAIPWPWRQLTRLSKALLPGTVTVACGEPGSSKSLWLLESLAWWHRNKVKVAVFELEDPQAYHLNRVLAQLSSNSDICDSDWVTEHPDDARAAYAQHRDLLDSFASCITVAPDKEVKHADVIAWTRARLEAGCQIIAIDPITAAIGPTDKAWMDDLRLLMELKRMVSAKGSRLVLVTHPKKGGKGKGSMDDLAGGAAYQRFAQCILWIARHKEKNVKIESEHGPFRTEINRTILMLKTRNGRGAGMNIGYTFEGASLRFGEHGVVSRERHEQEAEEPV